MQTNTKKHKLTQQKLIQQEPNEWSVSETELTEIKSMLTDPYRTVPK
jgi:hypothetical protein